MATATIYYGWSGDDAITVIKDLIGHGPEISDDSDKVWESCELINLELGKINELVHYTVLDSAPESDFDPMPCLHIMKHKYASCNREDFDENEFSDLELTERMKLGSEFVKKYPNLPKPSLKVVVVGGY